MEKEKIIKYAKIVVTCAVLFLFVWFLVIYPLSSFKTNEKTLLSGAKRYYDVNINKLPTGDRISTVSLKTLFHESYIKEDIFIPYSTKTCSINDSWVKVKKVNGEYKYYVYLECGTLKSSVDHDGPEVILKGSDTISLNKGDTYKELGVKSVNDKTDGTMKASDVKIDSSKVNTNKAGTYNVTYTISDSFNNKTVKKRKVKVISVLNKTVQVGSFINFSNTLYKVVEIEEKNVKITSANSISYVNYDDIEKWLDDYYNTLTDSARKLVVESKYCNDILNENDKASVECKAYTKNKKIFLLSLEDYNKNVDIYTSNYTWTSTASSDSEAYATGLTLPGFKMSLKKEYNLAIRPAIVINGETLILSGDGSNSSPYVLESNDFGKVGDSINTREIGEYISYGNNIYRIIDFDDKDGTTKVIANNTISYSGSTVITSYENSNNSFIYNPTKKGNVGYFINTNATNYLKTDYFANKSITVNTYDSVASYSGKPKSSKKYNVKMSAPSIYDLFTADSSNYWMRDSLINSDSLYVVSKTGVLYFLEVRKSLAAGVRIEAYLDKNCTIKSGKGTLDSPYVITK